MKQSCGKIQDSNLSFYIRSQEYSLWTSPEILFFLSDFYFHRYRIMHNIQRFIVFFIIQSITLFISAVEIYDLSCDKLTNPLGICRLNPMLGWKVKSSVQADIQTHYRILAATSINNLNENIGDLWDSGIIKSSEQVAVNYNCKALKSSSLVYWKVKIWTQKEGEQEWSSPAYFSIGLLNDYDWEGQFICFNPVGVRNINAPLFWKKFNISQEKKKYLFHVNSLGYHEIYLNGNKVGDAVLQPAVSQTDKRSLICTYDLTEYINSGNNNLVIWLSEGWFRTDGANRLCQYPVVRAQLQEINNLGEIVNVIHTDDSWFARESGYSSSGSWRPFEFGGEVVDANIMLENYSVSSLEQAVWGNASIANVRQHIATPQMVEPTRIMNTIHPISIHSNGDASWLIDFGTCLTGFLEINFPSLLNNQKILFEYADYLDSNGQFPSSRRGDFSDTYFASGKENEKFINRFNYHGFRYVKISNMRRAPKSEDIKAHLIHTDYGASANFESSDEDLNAIHDMIQYTIKCLTLGGYMVDCPHIERLGYGGDGNSSTPTLQIMYNVSPLIYNWVQAWADAQRPDGGMPHTAPAPYGAGGGPYWCGFFIIASWQNYIHYKDNRLVTEFYPQMKKWMSYVEKYSKDYLLGKWEDDPIRRNYFLGDWAAPENVKVQDSTSVELVNNCFIVICYEIMSKIASYHHKEKDAKTYATMAQKIRKKIHEKHYDAINASYASCSQLDLCYPMLAKVIPENKIGDVINTLKEHTQSEYKGNLNTGLVGVSVITQWATMAEQGDFMYSMLKKRSYPGYLYMIDQGATTTWEYWNGYRSRIHNCYNGIGSWFYEALGGIMPDEKYPGYEHVLIRPQLIRGVNHVKVSKPTPYGDICSEWKIEDKIFTLSVCVPFGSSATVVLPGSNRKQEVKSGEYIIKVPIE